MTDFALEGDPQDPNVLRLVGELDLASAEQFLDQVRSSLAQTTGALVLDLDGLEFVDSTGLGALVRIHEEARTAGKDVLLTRVPRQVGRILELTGLTDVFGDGSRG